MAHAQSRNETLMPQQTEKLRDSARPRLDPDNQEALEAMRQKYDIPVERLMNLVLRATLAAEIEITTKQKPVIEMEDGRILQTRQRIAFKL